RKIFVSAPEIVVDAGEHQSARLAVNRTYRWLSLAPPLLALLLCLWPRNYVLAMFIAVVSANAILARGGLFRAFIRTIDSYVTIDTPLVSGGDATHFTSLAVLLLFGSLFGVIAAGGGLSALLDRLERYASTRERGQFLTLLFGMLTFLNDFTHPI